MKRLDAYCMLPLLFLCMIAQDLTAQAVRFQEWPRENQLFVRDKSTNLARVDLAATVYEAGWNTAQIRVLREGVQTAIMFVPLVYSADSASFDTYLQQAAERANYTYELKLTNSAGAEKLIRNTDGVVAGDAFLVHGQSNAFATSYGESADAYEDPFVRTFGRHGGVFYLADTVWNVATGDGNFGFKMGAIGQWPLVMASRISNREGVPVAVINHAVGGMGINFFLKGDTTNFTLNYSLLLARLNESGLRKGISAVIWYQGETDAWSSANALDYKGRFLQLYSDLLADLSNDNLRRFLVCQTRPGCGGATSNHNIIAEYMRQAADFLPGVSVVSTNGLDGHDGCHYSFTDGYEDLGYRVDAEISISVYNRVASAGTRPPNPLRAYYATASNDVIAIEMRNPAETLLIEPGAESDFRLQAGPSITSVSQVGGQLILQLSGPATNDKIRYFNHLGSGPDILGTLGQGLLTFSIDIEPFTAVRTTGQPHKPDHRHRPK